MTEHWKQFSLYPPGCRNKFQPQQVLHTFLPAFIKDVRPTLWHVLFEPSALIRFQCPSFDQGLLAAKEIAKETGLEFVLGDCSSDFNESLRWPGEDYHGEADEYGVELWGTLKKFLQASSELALVVTKLDSEQQFTTTRKGIHLWLNPLGLNYLEEATVCRMYADRVEELAKEFHRL
jgi:hypothetical protein